MLKHLLLNRVPSTLRSPCLSILNNRTIYSLAYVTVADPSAAKRMARTLIEKKLAACVNIIPDMLTMYEWEGEIKVDHAAQLVIKTRTSAVDKLAEFVHTNNPIDISEVVSLQIKGGNPLYLAWIGEKVAA